MDDRVTELPWDEIASWFPKGMVPWLKKNYPDRWDELLSLEKELNEASFEFNEGRIQELLIQYRDFARSLAQEFEARKRGSGKFGKKHPQKKFQKPKGKIFGNSKGKILGKP